MEKKTKSVANTPAPTPQVQAPIRRELAQSLSMQPTHTASSPIGVITHVAYAAKQNTSQAKPVQNSQPADTTLRRRARMPKSMAERAAEKAIQENMLAPLLETQPVIKQETPIKYENPIKATAYITPSSQYTQTTRVTQTIKPALAANPASKFIK